MRSLEQVDEMLLSRILNCAGNTSNAMKYLELGVYPIRFEIYRRTILFLQYILKEDESSMIYKVLQATINDPTKNYFVAKCNLALAEFELEMTFNEIGAMSKNQLKRLLKENVRKSSLKYLTKQIEGQSKTNNIEYKQLKIQDYFVNGECGKNLSQLIFKARSKTLEIKEHKKWKFQDLLCVGCKENEETGLEILTCEKLDNKISSKNDQGITYDWFYSENTNRKITAGKLLESRLKERSKL